jgi:hypothetical protein
MMGSMQRCLLLLLILSPVSACKLAAEIKVDTTRASPVFTVNVKGSDSACVREISVDKKTGKNLTRIWSISQTLSNIQSRDGTCQSVFVYGQMPKGFASNPDKNQPTVLNTGQVYVVSVSGPGFDATQEFTK